MIFLYPYMIAGDDESEQEPIGIWGQRHLSYLKEHRRVRYVNLLTSGKLNDYLADLNEQAEAMFSQLVKLLAEMEGVTEVPKAENQMLWVQKMNNLRSAASSFPKAGFSSQCFRYWAMARRASSMEKAI